MKLESWRLNGATAPWTNSNKCNKSTSNTNKLQDTAASPVATVHTAVFLSQVDSCVLPSAKPEKKNPYFIALEVVLFKRNKVILKAFKEADWASLLQSIPKAVSPA